MANTYDNSLTAEVINNSINPSISSNLDSYESARSGFFVFEVHGLDNLIRSEYTGDDAANAPEKYKFPKAGESLRLNVVKCDVPHFGLEVLTIRRGNDQIKFAGVPSFDSGTLVVDDMIGLNTKSILMAWKGLAYNTRTRKGGHMYQYKKDCTLMEYTQDYKLLRTWTLQGCWISALSEENFDKENDGRRQVTATIQYDRAVSIDADLQFVD